MDLCMLYEENFILVVVVFICSRICPFLLLKCFMVYLMYSEYRCRWLE